MNTKHKNSSSFFNMAEAYSSSLCIQTELQKTKKLHEDSSLKIITLVVM